VEAEPLRGSGQKTECDSDPSGVDVYSHHVYRSSAAAARPVWIITAVAQGFANSVPTYATRRKTRPFNNLGQSVDEEWVMPCTPDAH
jgi:hypothetical protein